MSQWDADAEKATAEANKEAVLVVNYYCRVGSKLLLIKVDFEWVVVNYYCCVGSK